MPEDLSSEDHALLARIAHRYYVDGRVIPSPHRDRLIALSIEELRRVETVVAVVSEAEKPLAILGVLRAGVADVLVVDEGNAHAVLDLAQQGGRGADPARQPVRRQEEVIGRRVFPA